MPKHALIPTGRTGVSQSAKLPQSRRLSRVAGREHHRPNFCFGLPRGLSSCRVIAPGRRRIGSWSTRGRPLLPDPGSSLPRVMPRGAAERFQTVLSVGCQVDDADTLEPVEHELHG